MTSKGLFVRHKAPTLAGRDVGGVLGRVERSALWAAYGDALGWISELTNAAGLRKRTGGAPLDEPIAWERHIGGRSGVTVPLPRGCYSDDTQLRLATGRAIRPEGFDVEAFAKVELPVWLGYGLGGGKSTSAAAAQLTRRNPAWWSNRFRGWTRSGGNGAAMRIQPHVWASRSPEDPESYLPDVVRNSVCTHSHPTGLMGAVLHSLCVAYSTATGEVPSPKQLPTLREQTARVPGLVARDDELRYWRAAFQQEESRFDSAWARAWDEVQQSVEHVAACRNGSQGVDGYEAIVQALGLRERERRGSGILTAVAALGLAWCEDRPAEAMRIAANAVGTDTDTIASMAGAILGATADADPPLEVLDGPLIRSEAVRLARIGEGESPASHPYPDLLHWTAPKHRAEALERTKDGGLRVLGLGPARRLEGNPPFVNGTFQWQWIRLDFGQTLLIKTRKGEPEAPQEKRGLQETIAYVSEHIDDDRIVGQALRKVARKGTHGGIAGFSSALIDLLRAHKPD